jgi:hypothetical protein
MGMCKPDFLKGGIFWVPLMSWVELFPESRFIFTTFSQYVKDPNSVLAEIGAAVGESNTVIIDGSNNGNNKNNAGSKNDSSAEEVREARAMLDK